MFNFLKKLFVKEQKTNKDYKDPETGKIIKSAIQYNKNRKKIFKII